MTRAEAIKAGVRLVERASGTMRDQERYRQGVCDMFDACFPVVSREPAQGRCSNDWLQRIERCYGPSRTFRPDLFVACKGKAP